MGKTMGAVMELMSSDILQKSYSSIPPGTHYVEIGVWAGASLAVAARFAPPGSLVLGIDPWEPRTVSGRMALYKAEKHPALSVLERLEGLASEQSARVAIVPTASEMFVNTPLFEMLRGRVGCLMIDGLHTAEQIRLDARFIPLVIPGGTILFDDYGRDGLEGFTAAIDATVENFNLVVEPSPPHLLKCRKKNEKEI